MALVGNVTVDLSPIPDENAGMEWEDKVNCTYTVLGAKEMFMVEDAEIDPTIKSMKLEHMATPWSQAILITVTVLSFLTGALFIEACYHTQRSIEYGTRRGYTMFIIGLLPVFSITSLTGIYIPKAALVGLWAASVYLAVSLYIFLMLIINYFDGPDKMVAKLAKMKVSLAQPPLACCFPCCCIRIRLTSANLHRLRVAVLQMAVVHPMAYFVTAILWADGLYEQSKLDHTSAYLYLTVVMLLSTFAAMYALTIINVAADASLAQMHGTFRLRFSMLKFFMIVPSVQGLAINIVTQVVDLPCDGILSPVIRSSMIYNIAIVVEMFLLFMLGRCRTLIGGDRVPLYQAERADSLDATAAQHRYAEKRPLASPAVLLPPADAEANGPAFAFRPLDRPAEEWKSPDHEFLMDGTLSRTRTTIESDV